ncbi:hypothetical protein EYD45_08520 [Hyunsoonleella flava]|uniref:Uncharacterized protein n=1 Tax=Hyunsoonleella flava TaxID=2527939 RepID=A0A4Q9FEH2_9FLAO|nr:hypothetical protein [Hyunsoonleella flava]TBN04045.1 hypothetical protein EYD45_08520 [Hyunsoonleella flava]
MNYKYSICHPDKPEIEYIDTLLNEEEVLEIAGSYPWVQQLELLHSLKDGDVCYNPSLDFVNESNKFSLGLTAQMANKSLEFSLWYNRKVQKNVLFGLLGKKVTMDVIDKWGFSKNEALSYLKIFLNRDFNKLEKLMTS